MTESTPEMPTPNPAANASDDLTLPPTPAPAPSQESYWLARLVTLISVVAAGIGGRAVFDVVELLNQISNTREQAERHIQVFQGIIGGLAVVLALLSWLSFHSSYPALRLAGRVSIGVMVASLLVCLIPFLGLILPEILLYVPVAFFAAVVIRAAIDAWSRRVSARSLELASVISTAAGLTSLYLSVFVGKLFALAWGRG